MCLYTIAWLLYGRGAVGICLWIWLFGLVALRRTRQVEQVRTMAWLIMMASHHMLLSMHFLPETAREADPFLRTAYWVRQW
jgi:hypothetical protein